MKREAARRSTTVLPRLAMVSFPGPLMPGGEVRALFCPWSPLGELRAGSFSQDREAIQRILLWLIPSLPST